MWEYYTDTEDPTAPDGTVTWARLFEPDEWTVIIADMHSEYGVEIDASGALDRLPWDWMRVRLIGLLTAETRIHRLLHPPEVPKTPSRR